MNGLHWDPRVSLGQVIILVGLIAGGGVTYATLGQQVKYHGEEIQRIEEDYKEDIQRIDRNQRDFVRKDVYDLLLQELQEIKTEIRELRNR